MRTLVVMVVSTLLLLNLFSCASVQELSPADTSAVREIVNRYVSSALANDWDAWSSQFAEDAVLLPPENPPVQGRAAIREWIRRFALTAYTSTPVDIAGSGRFAYARGNYAITVAPPGVSPVSQTGKWILILEKQHDGAWRITRSIWNTNEPTP